MKTIEKNVSVLQGSAFVESMLFLAGFCLLIIVFPNVAELMAFVAVVSLAGMVKAEQNELKRLLETSASWKILRSICILLTLPILVLSTQQTLLQLATALTNRVDHYNFSTQE